jgi:serine/threonine-protein kinase
MVSLSGRWLMKIDPQSWPRVSGLLDQYLELPGELRAGWLDRLGPEHADVRPFLAQLIAAQGSDEDDAFLRTLPRSDQTDRPRASADVAFSPGTHIGPYRLVSELGQGGMGVVWLAERADGELKRPVALKLPLLSLHNQTLVERFARERDILAQLTHPRIARLYDAGVTDRGQPFLAIEYVAGENITDYCDHHSLSLHARLQLFLQVVRTVQFAHSNLIVHRDLKPANILVANDGDVRLLDFGIAKLLTEGEANETELTRMGGRALTPDYASPEQIAGDTITTASDVYSLGVILYELLTGERPYKLKRHTRGGLEEAILNAEPVRPSQVATDPVKSRARGLTPKALARALKGDLDTIVRKALNKHASQRYASADAFAQDIERYGAGQTVLAQPESTWYRGRKFILRNKLAVGAVCAIIAALGLGLGVALRQAHIAQVQSRTAETVRAFLLDIFRANSIGHSDPARARQTTARELLDIGANRIDASLNDAPEAKLGMLETLFRLYVDLGLQDPAVILGRRRVALAKSVYGPAHPEVARALLELASNSGESSYARDRPALLKEAGNILDRNRDSKSQTRALYYLAMGNASVDTDLAASAAVAAKSAQLYKQYPPCRELVSALNLLGQCQDMQEQYAEAAVTLAEAAKIALTLPAEARRPLPSIYAMLGEAQRKLLDFSNAEKSSRQALRLARELKGEDSIDVVQTEWRLGILLAQTSRPVEGLQFLQQALDLAVRTTGNDETYHTPMVRRALAVHSFYYGRPEVALAALRQVVEVRRRDNDRDFAYTLDWLAVAEMEFGHFREAQASLEEASAIRSRLGGSRPWELTDALLARARFLMVTGKPEEAARLLEESPLKPDPAGAISYDWLEVSQARADADLARGLPDRAIAQAASIRKRIADSGLGSYFKRWDARAALAEGKGLLLTHRPQEALSPLQRAVQLGSEIYDPDRCPALADSHIALASCLLALGRRQEARAAMARAQAIHATYRELGEQYKGPLRAMSLKSDRQ